MHQPFIQLLGVGARIAEAIGDVLAEADDGGVEGEAINRDGFVDQSIGGDEDEFKAIVEDEGIEQGGVSGLLEVILQADELGRVEVLSTGILLQLLDVGNDVGTGNKSVEVELGIDGQLSKEAIEDGLFGFPEVESEAGVGGAAYSQVVVL